MKKFENFCIDEYGTVIYNEEYLMKRLYQEDIDVSEYLCFENKKTLQYNELCRAFDISNKKIQLYHEKDISIDEFDSLNQSNWYIPEFYKNIDVKEYVLNKCTSDEEILRVLDEYELFEKNSMIIQLKLMIYLVDIMRANNIVWGVGRGSSVSSYILYLIGVHKINSIKYELDIKDFLT